MATIAGVFDSETISDVRVLLSGTGKLKMVKIYLSQKESMRYKSIVCPTASLSTYLD